jgi:para-aminobenzoate synthetase component 1
VAVSRAARLFELPYLPDSCALFERIRDLPAAAFLDSAFPHARGGRFDILTADPLPGTPQLAEAAAAVAVSGWFDQLIAYQREHWAGLQPLGEEIPFCGGLLGHIDYEAGLPLNRVDPGRAQHRDAAVVRARVNAYEWAIVQDHLLRKCVLVTLPSLPAARQRDILQRLRGAGPAQGAPFALRARFSANFDADGYQRAFNRIKAYIRAGDCYQVNLAQRFQAPFEGDPWQAYKRLRAVAGAPWSAYMDCGAETLLSLSPERFLRLQGQHVETAPIKGTRPRHGDARADELAAAELRSSAKDRAENLMIVDLLRNDLGRSCLPGSIHVDKLFELQSFPTVHHLVSTISGELTAERGAWELLRDSFPGGSITGAPKRRAMQIIAELEPDPRRVFCGAFLYVSADGRMDSNIAIRSLLCSQDRIYCWAGGGIVADSEWQQEYQECFDKVGSLLTALESTLPGAAPTG